MVSITFEIHFFSVLLRFEQEQLSQWEERKGMDLCKFSVSVLF